MSKVKWIKIVTDIFDDEKMLLIESLPSSDGIIVIWFKLLCLAGKTNNSGVFMMNDKIAYTDEMLATIFRKQLGDVRLALQAFERFGMIEIVNNVITIPNWHKHQSLDAYEKRKERDRLYQKNKREKQKLLIEGKEKSDDSSADVVGLEEDIEEEREVDIYNISKDILCTTTVERILKKWNSLGLTTKLKSIKNGTNRYKMLKARIKQYSEEEIFNAIEEIPKSKFLKGQANNFEVTFDWFIKPNNFQKIIDGNYRDKDKKEEKGNYKGFDMNEY